jgi:mRNA interferase MazF
MAKRIGVHPSARKSGSGAATQYQPDAGDLIYLDFTPHAGTEQAGRRPALVLSTRAYAVGSGLAFVCPVTTQVKGGPFEVPLPAASSIKGVVLADHLRSFDWIARNAQLHSKAPDDVVLEVKARIAAILRMSLQP